MELKKGRLTARADSHGAELISLRDRDGTEYLWQGDPAFWKGRNPLLFPIVGTLRGEVRIGGKSFRMGRHGFARDRDFTETARGEDFVVYTLREDEQSLAVYPFPFSLSVRHTLLEDGFSTALTVKNTGASPLPFCIGAHTAFRCPLLPGERFEDYRLVFARRESLQALPLTAAGTIDGAAPRFRLDGDVIPLSHELFDREDTLIFDGPRSKSVSLLREGGKGVRVDFGGFPMIGFWTPPDKNAPFICIEPWHGCAAYQNESGDFEDKPHCILLPPGASRELSYAVTIL